MDNVHSSKSKQHGHGVEGVEVDLVVGERVGRVGAGGEFDEAEVYADLGAGRWLVGWLLVVDRGREGSEIDEISEPSLTEIDAKLAYSADSSHRHLAFPVPASSPRFSIPRIRTWNVTASPRKTRMKNSCSPMPPM